MTEACLCVNFYWYKPTWGDIPVLKVVSLIPRFWVSGFPG